VEQLLTIPQLAITWALEIGNALRFSSIKKAGTNFGLCEDEQSSAIQLQRALIEAARQSSADGIPAKCGPKRRASSTWNVSISRIAELLCQSMDRPWQDLAGS
jgi:hypothetical protein